jgi:hypothetical protein
MVTDSVLNKRMFKTRVVLKDVIRGKPYPFRNDKDDIK